jgi:hypothetical protein
MQLTAPNRDTTQPAYGGKLRLYDVHLAKMFETSHFLCQQSRGVSGYEWVIQQVMEVFAWETLGFPVV